MQDPTEFPWDGVLIMGATVLSLFLLFALTVKIAEWVISARDELRDRYVGSRWKPIPIDILALPLWIALELLCFVAGVAFALLMMIVAYQVAKGARDWWHAGDRERGR
jgi:hypothetical protein